MRSSRIKMTRELYIIRAKRLQILGSLLFIFVGSSLLVAIARWLGQSGGLVESLRQRLVPCIHPDLVGVVGMLPLLPIWVIPILFPLLLVYLLDRRIGLCCPHCGRSLTLRCRYRAVISTGHCELCHESVFQSGGSAELSAGGNAPTPRASA